MQSIIYTYILYVWAWGVLPRFPLLSSSLLSLLSFLVNIGTHSHDTLGAMEPSELRLELKIHCAMGAGPHRGRASHKLLASTTVRSRSKKGIATTVHVAKRSQGAARSTRARPPPRALSPVPRSRKVHAALCGER